MVEPWATPRAPELETLIELGRGGMGTAYLARALGAGGFERLVVIKRLSLELRGTPSALERFLSEARVAARLHHANIVGTHQVDRDAAGPFIVLDYVEGGSLDDLVVASAKRGERLPVPVVLRIALDALAGLAAVHEATDGDGRSLRILHRDVSLQNVLVGVHDGVARLADFGVAKSVLGRTQTHPGYLVGKVLYLTPEYLLGEPIDLTLDLYALGMTLWLALTGEDPWPNEHDDGLVHAIVSEGVPSLRGRLAPGPAVPELVELVERACAREPARRFQSAREMAGELERVQRKGGWVCSHGEVAECVERLLGAALRVRREEVARLVRTPAVSGVRLELAPTARSPRAPAGTEQEPPPRPALPRAEPRALGGAAAVAPSALPQRWLWMVGASALGFAVIVGGLAAFLLGDTPSPAPLRVVRPEPEVSVPALVPFPAPVVQPSSEASTPAATPDASANESPRADAAPEGQRASARGLAPPTRAVTRRAAPEPKQSPIRVKNPYR